MKSLHNELARAAGYKGPVAAALCAGVVGLSVVQGAVYDFESVPLNHALRTHDGWLSEPSLGEVVIRRDDTPVNGSQVAEPLAGLASGWMAFLTRVNDSAFRYSPFFGGETEAVLQFETNAEAASGFALGRDVDGDGLLDREAGEVGPVFGTLRDQTQGEEQFVVVGADLLTVYSAELNGGGRCCNEDGNWYRLQLRMDLAANGGAGSGSLYYMNLTRGDTRFEAVAELQDVNLRLDAMHPDAGPDAWNAMWLAMRFEGAQSMPSADNLNPRVVAVLGADMTLSLQGVDAQAVLGSKYDVVLTPVSEAANPGGYSWRLNQFAVADPGTPSATTLLPSLDLALENVDVQAVFPAIGSMSGVCLRYQGSEGGDPLSMTWSYDPLGCQ